MKNQPCWGVFAHGCEYVQMRGIKVTNPYECVNTDGIDIDCCRFVTISDCIIQTGDDAIAIRCDGKRLKQQRVCENITITNCVLASNSCVFRLGVGIGEIRHVRVSNLTVTRGAFLVGTATSYMGRGHADIEDVSFSDISAYNIGRLVCSDAKTGSVKNLVMKNINAKAGGIYIVQGEEGCISDWVLKDIYLDIQEKKVPKDNCLVTISNTGDMVLENIKICGKTEAWDKVLHIEGNEGLSVKNCDWIESMRRSML